MISGSVAKRYAKALVEVAAASDELESVRQDPRKKLTIFDQEYVEQRGGRSVRHRVSLTFRTVPLPQMVARVEKAGFCVTAVLGDYRGRAWDLRADVWLLLAARR